MTEEKIPMFLMSNQKKFSQAQIATVTERLRQLDDDKWLMITSVDYKDPTLLLVLSILAGGLGIDRFLLGYRRTEAAYRRLPWRINGDRLVYYI